MPMADGCPPSGRYGRPPTPLGRLSWLGGVLETGQLPGELVRVLLDQFQFNREDGGMFFLDLRDGRDLHACIVNLACGVDPFPGLECLTLMGSTFVGMVHLMQ